MLYAQMRRVSGFAYAGLCLHAQNRCATDMMGILCGKVRVKGSIAMPLYEHVFLAQPSISSKQVDDIIESCKAVILQHEGTVGKVEYWGLKPTAYDIKKNRKAHYALMNLDCSPAAVTEMERQMSITEDIIRSLTLRVDEWENAPSIMMRRETRPSRETGNERQHRGGRNGVKRPEVDQDSEGESSASLNSNAETDLEVQL